MFACAKDPGDKQEYVWEISTGDNTSAINGNVDGINFKFCLLDYRGRAATAIRTGKNFSFYFELTDYRKNDSLNFFYGDFIESLCDSGFCKVTSNTGQVMGYPYKAGECSTGLVPFYGKSNRYSLNVPWSSNDSTGMPCGFKSVNQSLLPRGQYYTEFTQVFDFFAPRANDKSALSVGPVTFKINFEIADTVTLPTQLYSLKDTTCVWTIVPDNVVTINTGSELSEYLSCKNTTPAFDSINNTLLLTGGTSDRGIDKIEAQLLETSDTDYVLQANITLNDKIIETIWYLSITTVKLPENARVKLVKNYLNK